MNPPINTNAIVIDTGSHSTKIGLGGEDEPLCVVRSATGTQHDESNMNSSSTSSAKTDHRVIDTSLLAVNKQKAEKMNVRQPFKNGDLVDTDCLLSIWRDGLRHNMKFSDSQISERPFLLSEPSHWSNCNYYSSLFAKCRQSFCSATFEGFGSPALYLAKDAVLSSFSHGKRSSMVFDLGAGSTRCIPIYDGFVVHRGCKFTKCAGDLMDEEVRKVMAENDPIANQSQWMQCKESLRKFMALSNASDLKTRALRVRSTRISVPNLTFPYQYNDRYQAMNTSPTSKTLQSNASKLKAPFESGHSAQIMKQEEMDGITLDLNDNEMETDLITHSLSPSVKLENENGGQNVANGVHHHNNHNLHSQLQLQRSISNSPQIKLEHDLILNSMQSSFDQKKRTHFVLPDGRKLAAGEWQCTIPELLFMDYHPFFERDLEDEWIERLRKEGGTEQKMSVDHNNNNNNKNEVEYQCTTQIWKEKNYKTFRFKGLTAMLLEALNGCDVDIRTKCMRDVIVCGGQSMMKGLIERLGKELSCAVPQSYRFKLQFNDTPRERLFSPWLGGSILCSTSHFQNMWITKDEYQEIGSSVVHRKCL